MNSLVYFSLNHDRKDSFYQYIKDNRICYEPKFSFALEGENEKFHDPRDLVTIIEHNSDKESLHIIIDYVSCCGTGEEINYSTVIRDIIMCYPEVQFLFDETFVGITKTSKRFNYLNFLFWKVNVEDITLNVLTEFHQFKLNLYDRTAVQKQFIHLLKGCNNMYDGSNLRHAIKKYKRDGLAVQSNYNNLQTSRSNYAAVVVEEEYHQNMFNGYCLYANGFRVFPIISTNELLWINEKIKDENNTNCFYCEETVKNELGKEEVKKVGPLLIRDYDLQFVDENLSGLNLKKEEEVITQNGEKREIKLNTIDRIRGAKAIFQEKDKTKKIEEYVLIRNENPYWEAFNDDSRIFYVSNGDKNANIEIAPNFESSITIDNDGKKLELRGIEKPLEGIYASFRLNINTVKVRYDMSQEKTDFVTSRTGSGGHSLPLDIYGIARSMVHRAEDYYRNGRNRLAALVAGEALEVLNGFHRSLMNKAYYIQAVSENAMAMSLLGGDEELLRNDINFRLRHKVVRDVKRMIPDEDDRYNLLYNIFNDCMLFCQQKEYFDAADEALSAMVYEKDGMMTLIDFFKRIWQKLTK